MTTPEVAYMGLILFTFFSFSSCLAWISKR